MNRKAVIFGIKGYRLTKNERAILKNAKPWGIILFSRNIKNLTQLKILIKDIKKIFRDNRYPILIDQEGGKVSRLNKIADLSFFSQNLFGKLYEKDKNLCVNIYEVYVNKVCKIFNEVGININTVPVLDVLRKESHKVIGIRCVFV
jgi:Beta-glucosidase-related glycosidases